MPKKIEIGSEIYVFAYDDLGAAAPNLIMSSHGGFGLTNGRTTVPAWTSLHFYAPHRMALLDPKIGNVIEGKAHAYQLARSGESVNDYDLSKYQGKHSKSGETYQSIQDTLGSETRLRDLNQVALSNPDAARKAGFSFVPEETIAQYRQYDILTVRNRWWMSGVKLSDALSRLEKAGRRYAHIHCAFCRVSTWAKRYESWNSIDQRTG
jgi:hypothetical protein